MTIQIDHLHKSYGSGAEAHEVLHDINLTIDSGEVFGILGSSGAGKSTLVRCINLLERPTSGKVRVDGEDITDAKGKELADVRAGIGMIFQNFSLFQQRTVLRNVTFPLELNHTPKNSARSVPAICLTWLDWPIWPTVIRASCPAASSSAWPSHARWPTIRPSCCATRPPAHSTPPRRRRSSTCCVASTVNLM